MATYPTKAELGSVLQVIQQAYDATPDDPAPAPTPPPNPFEDPHYYPKQPTLTLVDGQVDPNAKEFYVRAELDVPPPATCFTHISTQNGVGIVEGGGIGKVRSSLRWSPNDPLVQTVRVPILKKLPEGGTFRLCFSGNLINMDRGKNATITVVSGAPASEAVDFKGRVRKTYVPKGKLQYEADILNLKWSDRGGEDEWRTRYEYGRVPSNPNMGECGYFLDAVLHPQYEKPHFVDAQGLHLHPQKLSTPIREGTNIYDFGAAVLTSEMMPAAQIKHGTFEVDMISPSRFGTWPGFWALPLKLKQFIIQQVKIMRLATTWPPELDFLEMFNMRKDFNPNSMASINIHGGRDNNETFSRGGNIWAADNGLEASFCMKPHTWVGEIESDFVTVYIDGIEVLSFINPFDGELWHMLLDNALAGLAPDSPFNDGQPDIIVTGIRVRNYDVS